MNDQVKTIRGVAVPSVGIGTFRVSNNDAPKVVRMALDVGYRHVDTARGYENERGVGQGLRDSDVPREQVFVTTKVRQDEARPDDVRRSVGQSRKISALSTLIWCCCIGPTQTCRSSRRSMR